MAYYVRVPDSALGRLYGGTFVTSAPLVMHDACAHTPEIAGDPYNDQDGSWKARKQFTAPMGPGFDLCWDRVWSLDPETAPPCYCCNQPVLGRD